MFDSYCKLFIDSTLDYEELYRKVYDYLDGVEISIHSISSSWCEVSVKYNDYYNAKEYKKNRSDFVYWKYYIEVEMSNETSENDFINKFNKFIVYLKAFCNGIIPSCDYEESLNSFFEK